jgi:addiction module HigA family antidote
MRTTSAPGKGTAAVAGVEPHASMRTHPGELLAECLEEGLHLSVSEAARQLHVSRQHLHRVLTKRAPVTAELAVKLGRLCGNGPHLWLALQADWDIPEAQEHLGDELERVPEYHG